MRQIIDIEEPEAYNSDIIKQPETYIAPSGIKTVTPIVTKQVIPDLTPDQIALLSNPALVNIANIDFTKLENIIDLAPKISLPIEQGGAIVYDNGTTILTDGTVILPLEGEDKTNVTLLSDGSAVFPNGMIIEVNTMPEGSIVNPTTLQVNINDEILSVDQVKEVIEELKKENEVVKTETGLKSTKKVSYLDKIVNYIYSQIYKN